MRAHLTIPLVCLMLALTSVSARQVTPAQIDARKAELQKVLDAYAAGDREAVGRAMPRRVVRDRADRVVHERADSITRLALNQMLGDKTLPWNQARAAFTIEVAVALRTGGSGISDAIHVVRLGRTMVTERPNRIGMDASEDRLEALWHQIALALLQSAGAWEHNDYVTAISPRIVRMAQVDPPVPNRLALSRAVNATMLCCGSFGSLSPLIAIMFDRARMKVPVVTPDDALAMFDAAAEDPALRAEALVRAAFLESSLNRLPEALARLDRASPVTNDTLAYAAALIRGGVLDGLGRPDDAAEAYGLALKLAPTMQTPAIGRGAALQRAGRLDEASAVASQTRQVAAGGNDPWPIFLRGENRFIDDWLKELRTLLR